MIKAISKLNDEVALKEVLKHLEKLNFTNENALNFAKEIIEERDEVLAKLAQ